MRDLVTTRNQARENKLKNTTTILLSRHFLVVENACQNKNVEKTFSVAHVIIKSRQVLENANDFLENFVFFTWVSLSTAETVEDCRPILYRTVTNYYSQNGNTCTLLLV